MTPLPVLRRRVLKLLSAVCFLGPASVAEDDPQPRCIAHHPEPEFSDLATRAGVAGGVQLRVLIGREGGVPKSVVVMRSLGWGLDEQAVRAVSQWKFDPARSNGQPVESAVPVECHFSGPSTSNGYLHFGALTFALPLGVSTPTMTSFISPDFYPEFGVKHERGRVQFSVNEQGEPENFKVEEPSSRDMERAVLSALRQWRFRPAVENGRAISVRGSVMYESEERTQ